MKVTTIQYQANLKFTEISLRSHLISTLKKRKVTYFTFDPNITRSTKR